VGCLKGKGSNHPDDGGARKTIDTGKCQSFSPKHANTQAPTKRKARYDAGTAVLLAARLRFPNAIARLDKKIRRPLKVGIHADLIAAMPEVPADLIELAFGIYTTCIAYHAGCTEDAERLDLDGQAAGTVTADEAAHAKAALEKIEARKRRWAELKSPPTPTPTPKPERLSFSGLKAAAQRRREATAPNNAAEVSRDA
jgi:ProP effector